MIKIIIFRGDLSDISAKTATLLDILGGSGCWRGAGHSPKFWAGGPGIFFGEPLPE